jgi:NitT/TauT family transport system permease protein
MRSRLASQFLYPLAGVALIIAVWVLACWLLNIPTVVLPSPDKVLRSLIIRSDLLLSESWITLKETCTGSCWRWRSAFRSRSPWPTRGRSI